MRKTLRIALSAVLCVIIAAGSLVTCFAQEPESEATLLNIYGDGMLFQQKKEAVIKGNGSSGCEVICEVRNSGGNVIVKAKATANKKGGFAVSFKAPEGRYENYTITLYENGIQFRTLRDVVFGELWLASGQSNMQFGFAASNTYEQNKNRSEWLRFLYVDPSATYEGDPNGFPVDPVDDIENGSCRWYKGTDNIGSVSAVSVFFAQELQKEIDMPVGVLASNLGGSLLASWLSRETVENDPEFFEYIRTQDDMYLSRDEWDNSKVSMISTITANYNKKITPLRDFSIAGMIWYQGESEVLLNWDRGYYTRGLELLQSSYGELFGFGSEKMPFIATQVAPYAYGDNTLNLHNDEFIDFQKADPSSRAVTTIYDIDLSFIEASGPIHPDTKQPVGERMAFSANGLVYNKNDCYTAATVESTKIDGSDFYVTFKNTGDGLVIDGERAVGFALADESGIFVQADAEIVSGNTVRIYSDEVENPVSASYAFAENNNRANVYATFGGEKAMPIAPFTTEIENIKSYWEDPAWASCDEWNSFYLSGNSKNAGVHDNWSGKNAMLSVDSESAFAGEGGLNVISDASRKKFSVSPLYSFKDDGTTEMFDRALCDWSNYNKVTVMVRNNGKNDVKLDEMKIYVNKVTWFAPEVNACGEACTVIPADGEWHQLTFDLDSIYLHGDECGAVYSRRKLDDIRGFEFCFSGEKGQSSDLSIDEIRFTADASEGAVGTFKKCLSQADNPWEFFCGIFSTLVALIIALFS